MTTRAWWLVAALLVGAPRLASPLVLTTGEIGFNGSGSGDACWEFSGAPDPLPSGCTTHIGGEVYNLGTTGVVDVPLTNGFDFCCGILFLRNDPARFPAAWWSDPQFTLDVPFELTGVVNDVAVEGYGTLHAFMDSDGIDPVAVYDFAVPEPATWVLLALGVGMI